MLCPGDFENPVGITSGVTPSEIDGSGFASGVIEVSTSGAVDVRRIRGGSSEEESISAPGTCEG